MMYVTFGFRRFKWDHIAIVYSDDEYGNRAVLELEELAPNATICIGAKMKITSDAKDLHYNLVLTKLVQAGIKGTV